MQDLLQRQRTTFENHRLVCWWKHAPRMQCDGNELGNVDSCLLGFFMFLVCPWFLGQETEIVTRVVWAYSALALAGSLQEQEANHSRLKKLVCWFDWLDTIGHDWSNYLRTKNSIGSIGLFRPEVPPVFGRHCNRRTQDGSRYPIAVLNAKVLYFCRLFRWFSGKIGDVERQPDASYAVCSVASVIFASC